MFGGTGVPGEKLQWHNSFTWNLRHIGGKHTISDELYVRLCAEWSGQNFLTVSRIEATSHAAFELKRQAP